MAVAFSVRLAPTREWLELECADSLTTDQLKALVVQHATPLVLHELTLCCAGATLSSDERPLVRDSASAARVVVVAHWQPAARAAAHASVEAQVTQATVVQLPHKSAARDDGDGEADELTCRVCYAGTDYDRLIAPCHCIGSMRLVHAGCLDEWRMQSANPQSYHRCDQCLYVYRTERTPLAPWLESTRIHQAISVATIVLAVALASLVCGGLEKRFYELVDWDPAWIGNPRLLRAIAGDRLDRLLAGVLVVSAAGFALSLRDAFRAHQGGHLMPWLTALASGFSASGVRMFRVFAILGCLHSVNAVAAYVQGRARVYLVRFGERVLEAT